MAAIEQAAAKSAQDKAKAKADAIVADIKAAPENLQKEATKAGEAALVEVRETHKSERGGELEGETANATAVMCLSAFRCDGYSRTRFRRIASIPVHHMRVLREMAQPTGGASQDSGFLLPFDT